ncbi:S2/P23 family protein [Borrelia puertoricensis]
MDKNKSKHVVGTDKNIIPELKNKIKYSHAVAPMVID